MRTGVTEPSMSRVIARAAMMSMLGSWGAGLARRQRFIANGQQDDAKLEKTREETQAEIASSG
jgi:hypothetical protein